jgi:PAS domain S-box-containing protein
MKTLIIEDDPITRFMFERHIRELGHEAIACAEAETALETYLQTFYPLILLDLELPGMDGFEFCRRVRALPRGDYSMILVITAYDQQKALKAALDAGADDYLTKPVSIEQLQVRLTIIERQSYNLTERKRAEVERESLLISEHEQRLQAETLRQIASALNSSLDHEQVLHLILEQLARVVEYDSVSMMLVVDGTLEMVAYRGFRSDDQKLPLMPISNLQHIQKVIETRFPVIIPDTFTDERWFYQAHSDYIRCWLGVPLIVQGQVIGLLNLDKAESDFYTQHHADLVMAFANQAAVAIKNARLYEQAQQEILERKRAEDALIQEQALLQALMDNVPDHIYFKDSESRFIRINKAMADWFGLDEPEHALGKTDFDFFAEEHARLAYNDEQEVMRTGQPLEGQEEKETWLDGRETWVSTTKAPLRNKEGHIIGTFGISRDITERVRAEEALRESEEKYRQLAENLNLIFTLRTKDKLLYASPAYEAITGRPLEDYYANPDVFLEYIHPDDREHITQVHYSEELQKTGFVNTEYRILRPDGTVRWLQVRAVPVLNERGDVIRRAGFTEDITERKQVEEELRKHREHLEELVEDRTAELQQEINVRRQAEEALQKAKEIAEKAQEVAEAANRAKSEFLANMSHEIRTPMNAILGFSEILKEHLRNFPQYHEYLNGITNGGHNLLRLINDILDLSKIEAGRLEIQPEAIQLHTIVHEIHRMFSLVATEKDLQFNLDISSDTPTTVLLDGVRLRQILVNLIGNAIKFTKEGSVTLRVKSEKPKVKSEHEEVKMREEERKQSTINNQQSTILFEVEDTGIGIPQEEYQQIFEPFRQAEQHARGFGGTGLGLAITKRLVDMMHGSISVESEVNKGSVFRVLFPGTKIVKIRQEVVVEAEYESPDIQFQKSTILMVEDRVSNREVIRAYLTPYHFQIIEVENGQEAIQTLKHLRPDLILMDIHMPVMDGYQATQLIKANQKLRTIPVVALTAYAMKTQKKKYKDIYDAYLSKPLSKRKLITTLAKFLPHTKTPFKRGLGEVGERGENVPQIPKEPMSGQREFLENTKVYVAQTGTFPQAFLDTLHVELLPKYEEVSELMSVDELIDFAKAITMVSESFQVRPLKHYAEELLRHINVFDIVNVKRLLAQFPEIIEIISNHGKGDSHE